MLDTHTSRSVPMHIKWIILAIACFRSFCLSGSMKSNGTILSDMVQQLNTTYSMISWAFAAQNGIAFMFSPCVGALLGLFSYKEVHVIGGLLVATCYILCGLLSLTFWRLFAIYVISGIGFGLCTLPTILALEDYHGDSFGTMVLIVQLFHFAGIAILPQILQCLKDSYGLNNSFILYGALMLNLGAVGFGLRQPRDIKSTKQSGLEDQPPSSSKPQASSKVSKKINVSEKWEDFAAEEYSHCCSIIFVHKTFTVTIIGQLFMYYILMSWAIFIVSLGTSRGLAADEAVMLSTSGGIGGLMGKISAIFLSHYNKLNTFVFWMFPCLINGLSLLACSVVTDLYILNALAFLTGFCIALSTSGLIGTYRLTVCRYHFSQATQIFEVASGLAMLFGGIIPGAICDVTGNVAFVYAVDGGLSIAILPLLFLWKQTDTFPPKCSPYGHADY